jgi:WD40 repeat protein
MLNGKACFFTIILVLGLFQLKAQNLKKIKLIPETGLHTGSIWGIATDARNRYVVTASEDRTLRIWESSSGRLLKTLRSPENDITQGKFFAVDISADASTIVAGGKLSLENQTTDLIYLYNRTTGKVIRTLKDLPAKVFCLKFSPDGKYILAGLEGNKGLIMFETDSGKLIFQDKNYQGDIYGIDFESSGKNFASVSFDGILRIYDNTKLQKKIITQKMIGEKPYSVAFSTKENLVAVGCFSAVRVGLFSYSGGKLSEPNWLKTTDIVSAPEQNLAMVCFSKDGKYLYAAGNVQGKNDQKILRKWQVDNRSLVKDIILPSTNTVLDIAPTASNQLLFSTATPNWGIIEPDNTVRFSSSVGVVEFSGQASSLAVSADGTKIQLRLQNDSFTESIFSIKDLSLSRNSLDETKFFKPQQNKSQLDDWENNTEPIFHQKIINLEPSEYAYCAATTTNADNCVVGTNRFLRLYNRKGQNQWKTFTPEVAWAANITPDNQKIIVAFGDGTVRWYRLSDGRELLALFIHPDQKRWILWNQSGFYACSVGGEDLIGWKINHDSDNNTDFFPISKYRDNFYSPSTIQEVLTKDLVIPNNDTLKKITENTPPVVTLVSPENGNNVSTDKITLSYLVESISPVVSTKVLVNGRPTSIPRGVQTSENLLTLDITIPNGEVNIDILVENKFGFSTPASARIKNIALTSSVAQSKLYLLSVGVSTYQEEKLGLRYAAKDALDFAEVFLKQKGKLYQDVLVKSLTNKDASKKQLLDGLAWLQNNTKPQDVAILFMAGHGFNDENETFCFLPVEANSEKLDKTGVFFDDIRKYMATISGKVLLFIDACHSGNIVGSKYAEVDFVKLANIAASPENGIIFFTSSTSSQLSVENTLWGNGAFTKAFLEGANGKADLFQKGFVTIKSLDAYLADRVYTLTNKQQTPTSHFPFNMADFSIILLK